MRGIERLFAIIENPLAQREHRTMALRELNRIAQEMLGARAEAVRKKVEEGKMGNNNEHGGD